MSRSIDVGATGDFTEGTMKAVSVEGRDLLLARVGDKYYAAEERCPHMGAHLSRGKLEGTIVTCPWHHSRFDLVDGRVLQWTDWRGLKHTMARMFKRPQPLKTYPAHADSDRVLVEVEGA